VNGFIVPFERDVESDGAGEREEEHAEAARDGQDVAAIIDDIGGSEGDPVSAS
jgi:hypothetical protein